MQRRASSSNGYIPGRNSISSAAGVSLGPTTGGSTSSGAHSPTAVAVAVMKTIMNSLALSVEQASSSLDDPRFHSRTENSSTTLLSSHGHRSRPKRGDVIYSMLEMHAVLAREYRPLATICEFYSTMHHTPREAIMKDDTCLPLSFELLLTFAMDFEIIPSFMDRLSLKYLHSEVGGYLKSYFSMHKKVTHPSDPETLKKVAFSMMLARLAMELFSTKREYETPEKQITAMLQWLDNSAGREKIMKKAMLPIVIKFSRKLYALKS
ncbi:hypothetical protein PINS_up005671 [Pythium insidiosum]|nr:hypothetical protein PINS_up005671 [Pythium insidiosum]